MTDNERWKASARYRELHPHSRDRGRPLLARLPIEPLLRAVGYPIINKNQCGRILQLNHRHLYRMINEGITVTIADRVACKILGEHPSMIWGQDWWDIEDTKSAS